MKDYYRILGVKKNASEEEIREHWIELMRKLHPDQRMAGTAEDERIKEVNEAYQVLKHSSTRGEYDLKRAYDARQKRFFVKRLFIPISIFAALLIVTTIYLKKDSMTQRPNNPKVSRNTIDSTNQIDKTKQVNRINQTSQIGQKDQMNKAEATPQRLKGTFGPKDSTPKGAPSTQRPDDPIDSEAQLVRGDDPVNQINQTDQADQRAPIDAKDAMPQRLDGQSAHNLINASMHQPTPTLTHQPTVSSTPEQFSSSTQQRIDTSTQLIATEGEVRQFFANYTERYTQRDLDSFISLFSSRAIQNHQHGLEEIRKIYDNFLKQSEAIQYGIDNINIEIYENAVEVKARYELVQMMKKSGDRRIWRGDIRWSLIKEDGALKILSLDYQHQKSP